MSAPEGDDEHPGVQPLRVERQEDVMGIENKKDTIFERTLPWMCTTAVVGVALLVAMTVVRLLFMEPWGTSDDATLERCHQDVQRMLPSFVEWQEQLCEGSAPPRGCTGVPPERADPARYLPLFKARVADATSECWIVGPGSAERLW